MSASSVGCGIRGVIARPADGTRLRRHRPARPTTARSIVAVGDHTDTEQSTAAQRANHPPPKRRASLPPRLSPQSTRHPRRSQGDRRRPNARRTRLVPTNLPHEQRVGPQRHGGSAEPQSIKQPSEPRLAYRNPWRASTAMQGAKLIAVGTAPGVPTNEHPHPLPAPRKAPMTTPSAPAHAERLKEISDQLRAL